MTIQGLLIDVFGTIDSPGTLGYPNASFTVTPVSTGASLTHFNDTGYVTPVVDMTIATSHLEFYKSGNLPVGNHTLTIVTDGVQDGGAPFYLDFLRVAIPTNGTYDTIVVDDAEEWVYTSNWNVGSHVGEYLDTWHATPLDGGSAHLNFYGTNISLYGAFGGTYSLDTPLALINVDEEPAHTITPRGLNAELFGASVGLRNQLVFETHGLPDLGATPRTLTVSIPFIQTPPTPRPIISAPSWFVDYAIYGPYTASASSTSGAATRPTSSPSQTPTQTPAPAESSSTNKGAIAGGVVGALAGLAIIIALLLLWRRKKQREIPPDATIHDEYRGSMAQAQPFVIDIAREEPNSATTWGVNGGGYDTKAARMTNASSSGGGSIHGPRSPGAVSSHGQSLSPGGSGSHAGSGGSGPRLQEVDGGVRLATSSTYESEVAPPTYAPYDRQ